MESVAQIPYFTLYSICNFPKTHWNRKALHSLQIRSCRLGAQMRPSSILACWDTTKAEFLSSVVKAVWMERSRLMGDREHLSALLNVLHLSKFCYSFYPLWPKKEQESCHKEKHIFLFNEWIFSSLKCVNRPITRDIIQIIIIDLWNRGYWKRTLSC